MFPPPQLLLRDRDRSRLVDLLLTPGKGAHPAFRQQLLTIDVSEDFDQSGHQSRPTRLVAGSQAGPVVAMKVFVEERVVFPVGIGLEFRRSSEDRPSPRTVTKENPRQ